jgi:hypothetical protein
MNRMWKITVRDPNTGKVMYRTTASKARTANEVKYWAESRIVSQRGAFILPLLPPGDKYAVEVK